MLIINDVAGYKGHYLWNEWRIDHHLNCGFDTD
jgi:hypothetical protein